MNAVIKTLVPNKEWLITTGNRKIASVCKSKKGYAFLHKGTIIPIHDWSEIKTQIGMSSIDDPAKHQKISQNPNTASYSIYDFKCNTQPHDPMYSVKRKLPLYTKNDKSKSQYCAGYYLILFKKGWMKSFCPKLITLERHQYRGPFKTEIELDHELFELVKNETTT